MKENKYSPEIMGMNARQLNYWEDAIERLKKKNISKDQLVWLINQIARERRASFKVHKFNRKHIHRGRNDTKDN